MSSQPGWYPDPAGTPNSFRWWDGRAWTQQTTRSPGSAPNGPGGSPSGPGGSPSGPGGGAPTPPATGKKRRGWLIIGAMVVVLALAVWAGVRMLGPGESTINAGDEPSSTVTGWDETSEPSIPPEPSPSATEEASGGASMTACPIGDPNARQSHPSDDRLHGGGLSVLQVAGWTRESIGLSWTYDLDVQTDQVQQGWFSLVGVAALSVADGFETPRQSARAVFDCMATSGFYQGMTGRKVLTSEAYSLGGRKGWRITGEVYVNNVGPDIKGDAINIVVVDTGSPESLGMYMSAITIGDKERAALAEAAYASLALD